MGAGADAGGIGWWILDHFFLEVLILVYRNLVSNHVCIVLKLTEILLNHNSIFIQVDGLYMRRYL